MSHPGIHGKAIVLGIDAAVSALVEEFLDAGVMPNLQKLIARGAYTRIRSVFPGVTPINWASVSTGAYPGTHGITDFMVLYPGDPLDGGRDGFNADTYQADTLWQAATRAGHKVATLNYPGASPPQHPNHLWIAARGSPAATSRYEIRNTSCFATEPYASVMRDSQIITLKGSEALLHLAPDNDPNGAGDFERTLIITMQCGQDTDTNASQAGALIGTLLGTDGIPSKWRDPIGDWLDLPLIGFERLRIDDLAQRTSAAGWKIVFPD